jgi:hypothetical protein
MPVYKSKFGLIKEGNLILYKPMREPIALITIVDIKMSKQNLIPNYFLNYFKGNEYDFIIMLDNQKQIKFSFREKKLTSATEFKKRILHMKFSLQDTISQ